MRYRLDVLAVDATDAARSAGGWLFDRAMAGWQVNVLVADARETRPMQILGARVLDLGAALESVVADPEHAAGLAVSAAALADERVLDAVQELLATGRTEVAMWGGHWPDRFGGADAVGYRLSAAARVFKTHAMAAAGIDTPVGTVESMKRGGYRPIDSDLVPID
ncbi:hypothetical protein H7I41_12470 [Mycobacterium manitobense]|uniref:Uncharacterized protein n=1 Tax=[Mycobacterium] manitobense TaxID=190147 RepID=A0A9X2YMN3_9MYCO|nr:hypothetical protein [[Mycobacterium] manitobense]